MTPPTIKEVASAAHVSPAAVSLYLNGKPGLAADTRERIADTVAKLGYVSRVQRRNNSSNLIGLLVERLPLPAFSDVFYAEVVQAVESRARQLGYHTVLTVLDSQADQGLPRAIEERELAGVLALGGGDLSDRLIVAIIESKMPVVLIDNYLLEIPVDCVLPDNHIGAYLAVRYLISRGHQRIGLIMGPAKYKPLADRAQGYVRAMMEAGLGPVEALTQGYLSKGLPVKGRLEMQSLLGHEVRPTAVFCVSDRTAMGALVAVQEAGLRVPEDVAVVGFDNVRQSEHAAPPLTTVHVPKREMGTVAVDRLAALIDQGETESQPMKLLLPTQLVPRLSA